MAASLCCGRVSARVGVSRAQHARLPMPATARATRSRISRCVPCSAILQEEAPATAAGEASTSGRRLTTAEWRAKYEKDGMVDLFLEDDFNAGQVVGRPVHRGSKFGVGTGEGPSRGNCTVHKVKIFNHYADQVLEVEVPEDRYILWEAEDQGLELPQSCRMGCCTACAVRVKEGSVHQPEALGVSEQLKRGGYALMCVAFPTSDCVLETVPEDEVYDMQFGRYFAQQALNPNAPSVERDDFAMEIAMGDE